MDLVQAQLRVARGERLWFGQEQVSLRGHAIECRINAEDPAAGFRPSLGTLAEYDEPAGYGVRVDSGARPGYTIPQHYDSLIAKLVAWGADRDEAIRRMRRALDDFRISGVATTIPFHRVALAHPAFAEGAATVNFIPRYLADQLAHLAPIDQRTTTLAAGEAVEDVRTFVVEVNGRRFDVRVAGAGAAPATRANGRGPGARAGRPSAKSAKLTAPANGVVSAIQGAVLGVRVVPGQAVEAGEVLFIVEAMKMENEISAPHAGTIAEVRVQSGQVVEAGTLLATYKA
jgi:acetyl-CoA/propionyl-CoA carboxylase biotin carboxyl carrier protein